MIQYKVVDKSTGKTKGWIVGKTPNRELVLQSGNKHFILPVDKFDDKYIVQVVEVKAA